MSRCEHGEKITKFCITEHCHHKEAAGCDYCIKKYHFHLTNTTLLSEPELETIVKTLTAPSDSKYKTRALQELTADYLRQARQALTNWLEQAQTLIIDRLTHPLLRKQGLLPTYQRLRNRDYRKVNAKDLKAINEFAKNCQPESFKK
jgi:CHAD domain-containing protein